MSTTKTAVGDLIASTILKTDAGDIKLSVVLGHELNEDGHAVVYFLDDADEEVFSTPIIDADQFRAQMMELGVEVGGSSESVPEDAPDVAVEDLGDAPVASTDDAPILIPEEPTRRVGARGGKTPLDDLAVLLEGKETGMYDPNQFGVQKGLQQFYTTPEIAALIAYVLNDGNVVRGMYANENGLAGRVLDPTAGDGGLLAFFESHNRYGMDVDNRQIKSASKPLSGEALRAMMPAVKRNAASLSTWESYYASFLDPQGQGGSYLGVGDIQTKLAPGYNAIYGSLWKYVWKHVRGIGIKFDTLALNPPFGLKWGDPRNPSVSANSTTMTMELCLPLMTDKGRGFLMTGLSRFEREILPAFGDRVTWFLAYIGTDWFGKNTEEDTVCAFFRRKSHIIKSGDTTDEKLFANQKLVDYDVASSQRMLDFNGIPTIKVQRSDFYSARITNSHPIVNASIRALRKAAFTSAVYEGFPYTSKSAGKDTTNHIGTATDGFSLISSRSSAYFRTLKEEIAASMAAEDAAEAERIAGGKKRGGKKAKPVADAAEAEENKPEEIPVIVGEEPTSEKWASIARQVLLEMRADADGDNRPESCRVVNGTLSLLPSEYEKAVMMSQKPPMRAELRMLRDLHGKNVARLAVDHTKWHLLRALVNPPNGSLPLVTAEPGFVEKVEASIKATLKAAVPMYPINPMQRVGFLAYQNEITASSADPFPALTLLLYKMNFEVYRGEMRVGGADANGSAKPSDDADYFHSLSYDGGASSQAKGRWIDEKIRPRIMDIARRAEEATLREAGVSALTKSDGTPDDTFTRKPAEHMVEIADAIIQKTNGTGIGLERGRVYQLRGDTKPAMVSLGTTTTNEDGKRVEVTKYEKWNALYFTISDPSGGMKDFQVIDTQWAAQYLFAHFNVPDPGDIASERAVEFAEARKIVVSVFEDNNRNSASIMERMRDAKTPITFKVKPGEFGTRKKSSTSTGESAGDWKTTFDVVYRDATTIKKADGTTETKHGSHVAYLPRGMTRNASTGAAEGDSFQLQDVGRLLVKGSGLLSWEQGLGKTLGGLTFAQAAARWRPARSWGEGNRPTRRSRPGRNVALFVAPQDLIPQWQNSAFGTVKHDGHGGVYFERGFCFPTKMRLMNYDTDSLDEPRKIDQLVNGFVHYVLGEYPSSRGIAQACRELRAKPEEIEFSAIVRGEARFYTLTDADIDRLRAEYAILAKSNKGFVDESTDMNTVALYGFKIADRASVMNNRREWPSRRYVRVHYDPDADSWTMHKAVRPQMQKGTKPEGYIPPAKPRNPLWVITHHEGLSTNVQGEEEYLFNHQEAKSGDKARSANIEIAINEIPALVRAVESVWKKTGTPVPEIFAKAKDLASNGSPRSLIRYAGRDRVLVYRDHLLRNVGSAGVIDQLRALVDATTNDAKAAAEDARAEVEEAKAAARAVRGVGATKETRDKAIAEREAMKEAARAARASRSLIRGVVESKEMKSLISRLEEIRYLINTTMPVTSIVGVPSGSSSTEYGGLYNKAYKKDAMTSRGRKWGIRAIRPCSMAVEGSSSYCPECGAMPTESYNVRPFFGKKKVIGDAFIDDSEDDENSGLKIPKGYEGECAGTHVWDYVPTVPSGDMLTHLSATREVYWRDEFLSSGAFVYLRANVLALPDGAVEVRPGVWEHTQESTYETLAMARKAFHDALRGRNAVSAKLTDDDMSVVSVKRWNTVTRDVKSASGSIVKMLIEKPYAVTLRINAAEETRKTLAADVYFAESFARQHRDPSTDALTTMSIRLDKDMQTRQHNRAVRKEEREIERAYHAKSLTRGQRAAIHEIVSAARKQKRDLTPSESETIQGIKSAAARRDPTEQESASIRAIRERYVPHFKRCNYGKPLESMRFSAAHYLSTTFKQGSIVVDEVHYMKSDTAQRSIGIRGLRARHKVGMTGTPIGNLIRDAFWQLWFVAGNNNVRFPFDYKDAARFQDEFAKKFVVEIKRNGKKDAKNHEKILPEVVNITSLWRIITSNVIRRRMDDPRLGVKVPKVNYAVRKLPFGRRQAILYSAALDTDRFVDYFMAKFPDNTFTKIAKKSEMGMRKLMGAAAILGQFQILNFATTFPRNDSMLDAEKKKGDDAGKRADINSKDLLGKVELNDSDEIGNVADYVKGVPVTYPPAPMFRTNWTPKNWSTLLLAKKHAGVAKQAFDDRIVGIVGPIVQVPPKGENDWCRLKNTADGRPQWGRYGENVLILSDILDLGEWLANRLEDCGVLTFTTTANGQTQGPTKRAKNLTEFKQARGAVMCAGIKALGVGHDLTTASVVIINGIPWSPAELWQGIGRVRRLTSPRPVTAYVVLAYPGSMDERKWDIVQRKQNAADLALEGKIPDFLFREQSQAQALRGLQEVLASGGGSAGMVVEGNASDEDRRFADELTEIMEKSQRKTVVSYSKPTDSGQVQTVNVEILTIDEEKLYESYSALCQREGYNLTRVADDEEFSTERGDADSTVDGDSDETGASPMIVGADRVIDEGGGTMAFSRISRGGDESEGE